MHSSFKIQGEPLTEELLRKLRDGEPYEQVIAQRISEWLNDSPVMTVNTSGSTGRPKAIDLPKRWMKASAEVTGRALELSPGMKALLCIPAQNIGGIMMIVRAMTLGLDVHITKPTVDIAPDGQYDITSLIPPQVESLLRRVGDLDSLGQVLIGGAPMSDALVSRLYGMKGHIYHSYGMTETCSHVALKLLSGENRDTYFQALNGVRFTLDDDKALGIHIAHMDNLFIQTNDIVELVDEHRFIWKGRRDHIINSGAMKVIPEELERHIAAVVDSPFLVHQEPDEQFGQRIILVIEGDLFQKIPVQLMDRIRSLGNRRPRRVYTCPQLKRTKSGKIIRDINGLDLLEIHAKG
jgi:O-succinylbenzoic acid--CoA ligase